MLILWYECLTKTSRYILMMANNSIMTTSILHIVEVIFLQREKCNFGWRVHNGEIEMRISARVSVRLLIQN